MDLEKTVKWFESYAAEYFSYFFGVLRGFDSRLDPVVGVPTVNGSVIKNETVEATLAPKLLSFMLVSIVIGYQLFSISVVRIAARGIVPFMVVALALWFLFACLVHLLCLLLRGRASFIETISRTLQVLSVLYVVGAVAALIAFVSLGHRETIKNTPRFDYVQDQPVPSRSFLQEGLHTFRTIARTPDDRPFFIYLLVHDCLFIVYLPLALRRIHGFGLLRSIVIGTFTLSGVFAKFLVYLAAAGVIE